jgi:hypothetical protein
LSFGSSHPCLQAKAYEQQQKDIKRAKQSGVTKAKAEAQAKQKVDRRKDKKGKKGAAEDDEAVRGGVCCGLVASDCLVFDGSQRFDYLLTPARSL